MAHEILNFIYLSEVLNLPVVDSRSNHVIGRIVDLAAMTGQVYPKITGLLVRTRRDRPVQYIPWSAIQMPGVKTSITVDMQPGDEPRQDRATDAEFLLKKTFLDKQIISTSGYKVVRVNDLQLLVDNTSRQNPNLWLVHIDIGFKGLLRRLGFLRQVNAAFKWIVGRDMMDQFVSWKHVQPTSTTSVTGSLHLKTDSSKLSEIHPADLADILEDLGIDERISLIESLDPDTAAATLQEMPLKMRVQVAETLEPQKLVLIVNEMQMDETVDLLDEISPENRSLIFSLLPAEKVSEIKELSTLSAHGIGSIMNTDFITAKSSQRTGEILQKVQMESRRAELLYYIYILDDGDHLTGMVTLRHILASPPSTPVSEVMRENVIAVHTDTSIKKAARVFFKYNFGALPVLDEEDRMVGIVTLRDTLESVFPEIREESKG